MNSEEIKYPIYRKYVGISTWFKISKDKEFIEIKKVGKTYLKTSVIAEQYPEMLLIQDMINCLDQRWEVIEESLFIEQESKV